MSNNRRHEQRKREGAMSSDFGGHGSTDVVPRPDDKAAQGPRPMARSQGEVGKPATPPANVAVESQSNPLPPAPKGPQPLRSQGEVGGKMGAPAPVAEKSYTPPVMEPGAAPELTGFKAALVAARA